MSLLGAGYGSSILLVIQFTRPKFDMFRLSPFSASTFFKNMSDFTHIDMFRLSLPKLGMC